MYDRFCRNCAYGLVTTPPGEERGAEPRPATGGAQEGAQRPWWRRLFGG